MLSTLRSLKFIAATYVGHSILRRLAMTGSVGWNVFPVVGDSSGANLLERMLPHVGEEIRMWIKHDSDFAGLHNHPRFQRLLKSIV